MNVNTISQNPQTFGKADAVVPNAAAEVVQKTTQVVADKFSKKKSIDSKVVTRLAAKAGALLKGAGRVLKTVGHAIYSALSTVLQAIGRTFKGKKAADVVKAATKTVA